MNYIKLIPKALRTALYLKLLDELQQINEQDVQRFSQRVLAAARKVLALQ